VTAIGNEAFWDCSNLLSATIPDSLATLGTSVFGSCNHLADIYYTGTQAQWEAIAGLSGADIPQGCTVHYEYNPNE
jgi:hypothetical protein